MPRRYLARVDAELSDRTLIEIARAQLFDVDGDRKKRIDDAIDYFGATRPSPRDEGRRTAHLASTRAHPNDG
jgi:hypothetical protein